MTTPPDKHRTLTDQQRAMDAAIVDLVDTPFTPISYDELCGMTVKVVQGTFTSKDAYRLIDQCDKLAKRLRAAKMVLEGRAT